MSFSSKQSNAPSNTDNSFHQRFSIKKALLCFGLLWLLVFVSSLLYYTLGNAAGHSYWYVLNSSLFFINIPVFCYVLLSFVAECGLFNGLRYSVKQVRTFFFKHHRSQLMEEYSAANEEELKTILKEKYLYTSPSSELTPSLLLASGVTFLLMVGFAMI